MSESPLALRRGVYSDLHRRKADILNRRERAPLPPAQRDIQLASPCSCQSALPDLADESRNCFKARRCAAISFGSGSGRLSSFDHIGIVEGPHHADCAQQACPPKHPGTGAWSPGTRREKKTYCHNPLSCTLSGKVCKFPSNPPATPQDSPPRAWRSSDCFTILGARLTLKYR